MNNGSRGPNRQLQPRIWSRAAALLPPLRMLLASIAVVALFCLRYTVNGENGVGRRSRRGPLRPVTRI